MPKGGVAKIEGHPPQGDKGFNNGRVGEGKGGVGGVGVGEGGKGERGEGGTCIFGMPRTPGLLTTEIMHYRGKPNSLHLKPSQTIPLKEKKI